MSYKRKMNRFMFKSWFFIFSALILASVFHARSSKAGVFNLPRLVDTQEFAVCIQPELYFPITSLGIKAIYSYGLSDLYQITGILGTNNGLVRLGAAFNIDLFPDFKEQPGAGVAVQGLWYQALFFNAFEWKLIPYLHKSFKVQFQKEEKVIEPFFALPFGVSLTQGLYTFALTSVIGAFFKMNDHLFTVLELGVGLGNSADYVSTGVIYYH